MIKLFSSAKVLKKIEINAIFELFFASLNNFYYLCSKNLQICVKITRNWTRYGN